MKTWELEKEYDDLLAFKNAGIWKPNLRLSEARAPVNVTDSWEFSRNHGITIMLS